MVANQLHRPLPPHAPLHDGLTYDEGETSCADLPCFYWSSGEYCFEVNAYILNVWRFEKASLLNNGGSLRQYCMQITHLVRFLEWNRLGFLQLTDTYFTMFIKGLSAEVDEYNDPIKVPDTVRAIGTKCLDCLSFISSLFNRPDFVSEAGVVKAFKVNQKQRRDDPSHFRKVVWYHHSFPLSSGARTRSPITPSAITALKSAARKCSRDVASRSLLLISILVNTGSRRCEAARIRVPDIMRAYRSSLSHPLVKIPSAKGSNEYRFVPVPHVVIDTWVAYIEGDRADIIYDISQKPQYSGFVDHGFVFVNAVNGNALAINTITNGISDLKQSAGISERSHPHMFRHRFITEKFKELIVHYDLQNTDVMRRALANADVIKRVLQEWTGHKITESLDRYIHLAYNELARMEAVVSDVFADASVKALSAILDDYEADYRAGLISAQDQEDRSISTIRNYLRTRT